MGEKCIKLSAAMNYDAMKIAISTKKWLWPYCTWQSWNGVHVAVVLTVAVLPNWPCLRTVISYCILAAAATVQAAGSPASTSVGCPRLKTWVWTGSQPGATLLRISSDLVTLRSSNLKLIMLQRVVYPQACQCSSSKKDDWKWSTVHFECIHLIRLLLTYHGWGGAVTWPQTLPFLWDDHF